MDQSSFVEQYRDLAGQTLGYLKQANVNSVETKGASDGHNDGLLNGSQIKPDGKIDIVSNQGQDNDLLDSLGF